MVRSFPTRWVKASPFQARGPWRGPYVLPLPPGASKAPLDQRSARGVRQAFRQVESERCARRTGEKHAAFDAKRRRIADLEVSLERLRHQ